jgi:hypothetical protein
MDEPYPKGPHLEHIRIHQAVDLGSRTMGAVLKFFFFMNPFNVLLGVFLC